MTNELLEKMIRMLRVGAHSRLRKIIEGIICGRHSEATGKRQAKDLAVGISVIQIGELAARERGLGLPSWPERAFIFGHLEECFGITKAERMKLQPVAQLSFEQQIDAGDEAHAHALGIRLDAD
jgi:hypothetical protein